MDMGNTLAFLVFPYIALTVFCLGHGYRYITDRYGWTAKSSEFLEKKNLFYGATIFHWGIILVFLGHAGGLLTPQSLLDQVGINGATHSLIAHYAGLVTGAAALVGLGLLLRRRTSSRRLQLTTTWNDYATLIGLTIVVVMGLYNVIFGDFYILDTVAPWIRSIVTFTPHPELMKNVPFNYKVHIVSAFALLALSPFSRLVHIWSLPLGYFLRGWILFRRQITAEKWLR